MAIEDDRGLRGLLRGVLEAPAAGLDDLPELLAMLEHEDPQARIGAAWAICAVAAARPDAAQSIYRQLQHRSRTAATLAAEWIEGECDVEPRVTGDAERAAARSPDDSDETDESDVASDRRDRTGPEDADGSSRSTGPDDGTTEPGVAAGRQSGPVASPPEGSATQSPHRSTPRADGSSAADASHDPKVEAFQAADAAADAVAEAAAATARNPEDAARSDEARDRTAEERDGSGSGGNSAPSRPPGTDRVVEGGRFAIELDRTAIDALDVVERVATDRCSWTYAGMATVDAEERAVLVRTFRPPEGARLARFADAFEEQAEAWAGVDDHEGVLTVFDHGRRPHPWIVVGYAHQTVRTAGRLPFETALRVVEDAARALAYAHERGVTHRSLDPRSVALAAGDDRPVGRLLNFGLVDAVRAVDGPLPLDSRFAAPELFGDEFGTVDHLTDVYQLGAVLYTALTGRPPYDESLVGRGGPAGVPLAPPSTVVGSVLSTVDRVVETAMATHKLARYEGADEFATALGRALEAIVG